MPLPETTEVKQGSELQDTELAQSDDQLPIQSDVRDNPQSSDSLIEATVDQPENDEPVAASDSVWSDISPPLQRSQPIDWGMIELGDRLLLGGSYVSALKHYGKLWQTTNLPMDNAVLIRLALASELAGLHDDSIKHYRSAIRVSEKGSVAQANCLLGIARVWENRGQVEDAISLLSELFLLYGGEQYPTLLRAQLLAQLSDVLQKRLLKSEVVIEAMQKEPMEYYWPSLVVDNVLALADWEAPADGIAAPLSQIKILQAPRPEVSLILIAANVRGLSVLGLISELERRTDVSFVITERAKSDLVGRMCNIQTSAMPVILGAR